VTFIVITCHNEAEFIERAVESALTQSIPAGVIVIDDGSTDGSDDVLARLSREAALSVFRVTQRGMPAARNAGLALADSEFVAFLDGDDWLEPDFVQETLDAITLARRDVAAVLTDIVRHYESGNVVRRAPLVPNPTLGQLWQRNTMHSTAMFRRQALLDAGGFHPAMAGHCDWDMWIDLAERGWSFGYTRLTAYHYTVRKGSFSTTETAPERMAWIDEMRRHHGR
jgi:glycosyltransferase involved in cell wall biosynthesis